MATNTKKWLVYKHEDPEIIRKLERELNVDEFIATLLYQRGIRSFDEARDFFRPQLENLHSPFEMKDMEKAVKRLSEAVSNGEKILVYGDYDVDGTSAVALMYSYLNRLAPGRVSYYIPDRYTEGYGISEQGVNYAANEGCKLIVALDCGIRSHARVEQANALDIDFIICDHHLPAETLPAAYAILNPKRNDCKYPYNELSGCGIGFKLVQAMELHQPTGFDVKSLLDLVVLSIAADIVPITGENRILAWHGLERVNKSPRPGIKALLKSLKESESGQEEEKKQVTISDLVFTAAPRVNAAGRIDHGKKAVELLVADNIEIADVAGELISDTNSRRRDIDRRTTEEALAMLQDNEVANSRWSIVLFNENWHKGIVGIVASRVLEKYHKPTIILTEKDGVLTGSARSIEGFDIHEGIRQCESLLLQFGGHYFAAGLTLKKENLNAFIEKFEQVVRERITEDMLTARVKVDLELDPEAITPKFYRVLKQFAPFGPGNMSPVFMSRGVTDDGSSRIVGTNHLKLRLGKTGTRWFDAIGFGMAEFHPHISRRIPCDICYSLEENSWRGNTRLQMVIKDMRF